MSRIALIALALGGALAATGANAQSFTATLGYQNTDPKSDNGTLAGARASVNDDWSLTGSFAYGFNDNLSVELWSGLTAFEHEVSLQGLGTVATVEHRPTTLSLNYHFNTDGQFRPFIGAGYGIVNVSGEQTRGALAGLGIDGDNANGLSLTLDSVDALTDFSWALRQALSAQGITGDTDAEIDHIELIGPPADPANHGRNFVLCPGKAYDRSPCGTGTSAKLACLAADGKLAEGQTWVQASITGSQFQGRYEREGERIRPFITGRAYMTADSTLLIDEQDPFAWGI